MGYECLLKPLDEIPPCAEGFSGIKTPVSVGVSFLVNGHAEEIGRVKRYYPKVYAKLFNDLLPRIKEDSYLNVDIIDDEAFEENSRVSFTIINKFAKIVDKIEFKFEEL